MSLGHMASSGVFRMVLQAKGFIPRKPKIYIPTYDYNVTHRILLRLCMVKIQPFGDQLKLDRIKT
eukprot:11918669-Karenia_brevis.AAC.1